MRDIVFVDVETTGLAPESRVVEVALMRRAAKDIYSSFNSVDIHTYRILPPEGCHVEPKALEINGFSREAWADEKNFHELSGELYKELEGAIVAGWNVKFDLGMMEHEFRLTRYGYMPWHYHSFDVMCFMMPLYFSGAVKSLSLHAACDYFCVSNEGEHGAAVDVVRTMEVLRHLARVYDLNMSEC